MKKARAKMANQKAANNQQSDHASDAVQAVGDSAAGPSSSLSLRSLGDRLGLVSVSSLCSSEA